MSEKTKGSFFDKLPPTLIKKNNVTLIPEGAIGYLLGPTLALLGNSVLSAYFNKYMSDVLSTSGPKASSPGCRSSRSSSS